MFVDELTMDYRFSVDNFRRRILISRTDEVNSRISLTIELFSLLRL